MILHPLRRFNPHKRQKLDIGQVLVVDAADCRRDLDEHPSDDQRIALVTRIGTASRSAGLNADKLYTEKDMRRREMESDLEEPDFTHNDLEHDVDWIIANDSKFFQWRFLAGRMSIHTEDSGCQTENSDNPDQKQIWMECPRW